MTDFYTNGRGMPKFLRQKLLQINTPFYSWRTALSVLVFVCFQFVCIAQEPRDNGALKATESIKPLGFGDEIPDELWEMPLQVVNHPEGREVITLNDYRGKLIILDFWRISCKPCITSLHKLDSLQKELKDDILVIPITYEEGGKVKDFFDKRSISIPSVVSHEILKEYFPHRLLPHQVWILNDRVRALPMYSEANKSIIQRVLSDDSFTPKTKKDFLDYSSTVNILPFAKGTQASILTTSFFSEFIDGAPGSMGERKRDDRIYVNYVNVMPMMMYGRVLNKNFNRILIRSTNLKKIDLESDFSKKFLSYQLIVPDTLSDQKIKNRILSDLNFQFNVEVDSQILNMDCYVITKSKQVDSLMMIEMRKKLDNLNENERSVYQMVDFIESLNFSTKWDLVPPIIIDESGYSDSFIGEPLELLSNDIQRIKANLMAYGLTITKEVRPVEMYVLKDLGR